MSSEAINAASAKKMHTSASQMLLSVRSQVKSAQTRVNSTQKEAEEARKYFESVWRRRMRKLRLILLRRMRIECTDPSDKSKTNNLEKEPHWIWTLKKLW